MLLALTEGAGSRAVSTIVRPGQLGVAIAKPVFYLRSPNAVENRW